MGYTKIMKPRHPPAGDNDTPAPRTIRIGAASIGLIGLDPALNTALAGKLGEEEAADFLFAAARRANYIPPGAEELYRQALRAEYLRRQGRGETAADAPTIRVLGKDCLTCNSLSAMLFEALQKLGLAADMESVHDPDEIGRYGVTRTPALIINNRIECAGRMPSQAEVETWLRKECA
jgi:hypothetical protein